VVLDLRGLGSGTCRDKGQGFFSGEKCRGEELLQLIDGGGG